MKDPDAPGWRSPNTIAHLAALLTSIGALAAAFQACSRPEPTEEKADKVYETLRERVEEQTAAQRQTAQDLRELRAWMAGYLRSTGVRLPDSPGGAPAASVRVVLEPAPAGSIAPVVVPRPTTRSPIAQGVRVLTPLPSPKASSQAVPLPANADAL